jgi:hypothetical protein
MRLCTVRRTVGRAVGRAVWRGRPLGAARNAGRKKPGKISKKPTVTPIMAWESLI